MTTGRRRVIGTVERALLGVVFGVIAWIIERRVLRSIKRGAVRKKPGPGVVAAPGADGLSVAPKEVHE
ncbi:MAG: hypothetical protein HYU54_02585 [Actinobacteria bacterium]|nr:hypothetical protein [Actinomycetota bacterium]